jgi:hypothetical protein
MLKGLMFKLKRLYHIKRIDVAALQEVDNRTTSKLAMGAQVRGSGGGVSDEWQFRVSSLDATLAWRCATAMAMRSAPSGRPESRRVRILLDNAAGAD